MQMGVAGSVKQGEESSDICWTGGDGNLNRETDYDNLFMSSIKDKGLIPWQPCCTVAKALQTAKQICNVKTDLMLVLRNCVTVSHCAWVEISRLILEQAIQTYLRM